MAINIIDHTALMTSKVVGVFKEDIPVAEGFSAWFPRETTRTLEVDVRSQRRGRKIAYDVTRFTEGQVTKMSKVTEDKYIPPYYEIEYFFNRDQVYMNALAMDTIGNATANQIIGQNALETLMENRKMIERAIRLQQAQVLQTGIITLINGDNINYRRKAASMVNVSDGAGEYWSNSAAATPLADIAKGGLFLRQVGTATGNELNMIGRSTAIQAFLNTTEVKNLADIRWIERVNIGFPQFTESTGFTFNGQIAAGDFRVNLWSYDEIYEDADGNDQYYLDEGNVILLPANFQGKTVFGGLPTLQDRTIGGVNTRVPAVVEADFLLRPFWDEQTISSGIKMSSAPIVIPITVDRIYTMKVLA